MKKIGWEKQFDAKYWMEPLLEEIALFESQKIVKKVSGKKSNYTIEYMSREKGYSFFNFRHRAGIEEDALYYYDLFVNKDFLEKFRKLFFKYKKNEFSQRDKLFNPENQDFFYYKNMFLMGFALSKFSDPSLLEKIEFEIKKIGKNKLNSNSEIILFLNSFQKLNFFKLEELYLLKAALKLKENVTITNDLKLIEKKFGFSKYVRVNKPISLSTFKKRIREIVENNSKLNIKNKIEKLVNFEKNHLKKKNKIIKKYKLTKKELKLFDINAELGHLRLELRLIWIPYYCQIYNSIKRTAKKYGIKKSILLNLNLNEYENFLESGKLEKNSFTKTCLLFIDKENEFIFKGKKAKEMAKKLELPLEVPNLNSLRGDIANTGFIEGEIFVLHWNSNHKKEMKKMKEGSILVVTQTKPDMMDAIRKASGIITNEGGLISHAAIISRELGIPCLMKTNYATEIFKTGDAVVLDCKKGEVSKK